MSYMGKNARNHLTISSPMTLRSPSDLRLVLMVSSRRRPRPCRRASSAGRRLQNWCGGAITYFGSQRLNAIRGGSTISAAWGSRWLIELRTLQRWSECTENCLVGATLNLLVCSFACWRSCVHRHLEHVRWGNHHDGSRTHKKHKMKNAPGVIAHTQNKERCSPNRHVCSFWYDDFLVLTSSI